MYKKLPFIIPFLFAACLAGRVHAQAQESFVSNISYPYLQRLIDTAKKYYPEVKVRKMQVAIAKTTYHQTQISWFDIITPSYIYNPQKSLNVVTPSVFNGYQIAVTVNLGTLLAKPYQIHNARQAVDVARFQQDEYNLSLEANVKKLYFTFLETQADLALRTRAEQDAGANVKQMKNQFEKGEVSLKDYNDALGIMYTQTSYRIQGELAVFNAKVSLEEIVGKKLEDIK